MTPGTFAAYYIVWTLVRNMNIVLTPFAWEERIKDGTFSGQLMKPVHPIHDDLAQFAGWKFVVIVLWLPIAAVLILLFRPTLPHRAAMRRVLLRHLGRVPHSGDHAMVAGSHHVLDDTRQRDLRGVLPQRVVAVGPGLPTGADAEVVPDSDLVLSVPVVVSSFPIVALTGPIKDRDLFIGLGMQVGWILFSIGLLYVVWPRAVRRFSSVGG